ncbi:MAG: bifunctional lysine ketoglutarate reductase /saccharopine dehydrogenase family protein [Phycisphaerae bacterium]|jgi:alpha-aminoadipic semialdehyde synthase
MIGIRREDKSVWEGRVPLVPEDVQRLRDESGLAFRVQTSTTRAFKDEEYQAKGIEVADLLGDCPIIMGVKEIPPERIEPNKTYVYFAHVIKGQPANMPALRKLLEGGCTLIDYERIVDEQGRRLVFFGRYAGLAGMIDTLWTLGQRLAHEGIDSPFQRIQPAHRYDDLQHVRRELAAVADEIRAGGLPAAIRPLVCGFAGYGQVSQGAQTIYDMLPVREVTPAELPNLPPTADVCYKVVFREEHLVRRMDTSGPFVLQEYYEHPDRYAGAFFTHAPYLTLLVNCIYWEPKYPRLIDREQFRSLYGGGQPRLRVIGDISCDIDGSLECTTRSTDPENPVFVYDPQTGKTLDGVAGNGPVVLAVDFLPCELPVDASRYFSRTLSPFVAGLAKADYSRTLAESGLPEELKRATIVWRGALTEPYRSLEQHLQAKA